jgi:hypothetical protein
LPAVDEAETVGINGGLVPRGEPWRASGVSVRVDDIDATLVRIEAKGGKILRPKQAIGVGRPSVWATSPTSLTPTTTCARSATQAGLSISTGGWMSSIEGTGYCVPVDSCGGGS